MDEGNFLRHRRVLTAPAQHVIPDRDDFQPLAQVTSGEQLDLLSRSRLYGWVSKKVEAGLDDVDFVDPRHYADKVLRNLLALIVVVVLMKGRVISKSFTTT